MSNAVKFLVAVPLFALVFSVVTWVLSRLWSAFEIEGRGGLLRFYGQFLIISALYVALVLLGIHPLIGLLVMFLGYRYVFGAGWLQALVIGILGGMIGWALFPRVLLFVERSGLI
ncbi:MAG TPA: hypothetical protein VGY53_00355 [Isosphaeraceae bacterium]|jgi:hypothetical protein|nr:hypothetical protein [Isosphaeraceae bacterium]